MAGRTWKDLKSGTAVPSDKKVASKDTSTDAVTLAAAQSPRLSQLLEQRKELEARLHGLASGGGPSDPREAAKFHVPTFAERQAEQREWEKRYETMKSRAAQRRGQAPVTKTPEGDGSAGQSSQEEKALPLRQAASSATEPVNQWLNRRDKQRRSLLDSARDRLSPLNDVANVGRKLHGKLSGASNQLRDLDRQLAENGLTNEREELKALGTDKLAKGTALVDKYTKMAEAPKRAVDKIDQFWKTRQNEVGGAMDRAGPYVNSSRQRLSTEKGGSGDLFERMERNRMQALQRRKEQRREEERDEERRQRAKRNRRNGD